MPAPLWEEPPKDAIDALGRMWSYGRERAHEHRRVRDAVVAQSAGKTRADLRASFDVELDRQHVPRDPIWVERQLDELEASPAERALDVAKILIAIPDIIQRIRNEPPTPAWMALPDDATVPVWAHDRENTTVQIEPDAQDWLERVLHEAPKRTGDLAIFDVWFDQTAEPNGGPVTVHIGSQRIGTLDHKASQGIVGVFETASDEHAKPFASAKLIRARHLDPPYLLVIETPSPAEA